MPKRYYLSLGSNIDPEENLKAAVRLLKSCGEIQSVSSVYCSAAISPDDSQPDYLNAAVIVEANLPPLDFQRDCIRAIESRLGRIRTADKFAPRTIDIDIIMVDGEVGPIGSRQVPDPEIITRAFVAVPLAEIAPDVPHPLDGRTLAEIAASFQPAQIVKTTVILLTSMD